MGCDLVIVARTDALGATLLDTNIDPVDHPFIVGNLCPNNANKKGTFPEGGVAAINAKFSGSQRDNLLKLWNEKAHDLSLP
jgi:isocitrate lyase